jgi:predicted membrane-bound spermidine synthase
MIPAIYVLFVLSGAAGLIYEAIWTRYLGLFVGHDAYAQIIVLVIFLGGMSAGAMAVSRWTSRLKEPLYGYVGVELMVGCIGLVFHEVFGVVTSWTYHSVYPHVASSWLLTAAKWGIAGGLILPQSILLGMTFPLMSAGLLRLRPGRPGRKLSLLYFTNSLGAAVGVLVAGFYLVELAGLPGTLLVAAMLNLTVAAACLLLIMMARPRATGTTATPAPQSGFALTSTERPADIGIERLLLFTSMGTAVASFIYEIDWIRMLALVLGSATHSFELMLSAFILGLAFGAWWIRGRADRLRNPLRTLGMVQCAMGLLALATLPLYIYSFDWIGVLITTFTRSDSGYNGFTIAKYALCLLVMFPATFCAGMTLPLITRTLLANGSGERSIGAVYAWNTLGSILGVALGGLLLMPLIGLKPMLMVGAGIDMGLGLFLLARSDRNPLRYARLVLATSAAAVAILLVTGTGIKLDHNRLTSGVYRNGVIVDAKDQDMEFYRDGRTATVSVSRFKRSGIRSLATNGKVEASLTPAWYQSCDSVRTPEPLVLDAATQILVPLIPLAYAPRAGTAAIIGQGSGMSSHFLLGSPYLKELVTVEIEPQMIAGSRMFYPANRRVFDDRRSKIVIDDAKSYFASEQRKYDLIISEPSNPWVSGVSGLFTTEFYSRIRGYLTEGGIFGQWLQAYELDDPLVLSVLAGVHQNFRSYEVYLAPNSDVLVVASNRQSLPPPDWSVFGYPALRRDLCSFVPVTATALEGLWLAGRDELRPLLESMDQPNSDYYPVLDLGAERRRFRHDHADGFHGLSADWFNLLASISGRRVAPALDLLAALPENPRVRARAMGALLRSGGNLAVPEDAPPIVQQGAVEWRAWQSMASTAEPPINWEVWVRQVARADYLRNAGTAGFADQQFYAGVERFMDRHKAPVAVRDIVEFRRALASWNFAEVAATGERLLGLVGTYQLWMSADELRDGLVIARLHLRDIAGARRAFDGLLRFSRRPATDLRSQLLMSYVQTAEGLKPLALQR